MRHEWHHTSGAVLDMMPPICPVECRLCGIGGSVQDWTEFGGAVQYSPDTPCTELGHLRSLVRKLADEADVPHTRTVEWGDGERAAFDRAVAGEPG